MENFIKNLIKNHLSLNINQSIDLQLQLRILAYPFDELQLMALDLFENSPAIEHYQFETQLGFKCDIQNIKHMPMEAHFEQIPTKLLSSHQKILAEEIFQSLSPQGFLQQEEKEYLISKHGKDIEEVLKILQETTHLGYLNYTDYWICFLGKEKKHEKVVQFLKTFQKELSLGDFSTITRKLNVSFLELKKTYLNVLKKIPLPTTIKKNDHPTNYIVDLTIETLGDHFECDVLDPLPSFKFTKLMNHDSKDVNDFYKPYIDEVQKFVIGVNKRKATLEKLGNYLCKIQKDYLCGNTDTPRPINPKDLAKDLNLHPSTLARCLQHKTLKCVHGVVPLKSLVTPAYIEEDKRSLLQKLKNIISREDKNRPYSDEQLLQILKTKGSKVSRRTITKYRHELKIPDARRRFFR